MNKLPVYLYPKTFPVIIDADNTTIKGINSVMYQKPIEIQKGFKDSIQLQFKNSDQKPITLGTATYYLDLLDSEGRSSVISQSKLIQSLEQNSTSTVLNKGLALVTFEPADTLNLTPGNYKFVIKKANNDGTFTPAYSNTYYGITGDIELKDDGFPIGFPVQSISMKQLETNKTYNRNFDSLRYEFVSDWVRPVVRPLANTTSTADITLASFAGTIVVEGTLNNNLSPVGQANAQFVTATSFTTSTTTHGIISLSWNNVYTAVRFRVIPDKGVFGSNYFPTGNPVGSGNNKFPNGFVDQIELFS